MSANCDNLSSTANSQIVDCVFQYSPSVGAAGLYLALFAVLSVVHAVLAIRSRTMMALYVLVACVAEMTGFAVRIAVIQSWSLGTYIAMLVLLLISASILALANFSLLGRMVQLITDPDGAMEQSKSNSGRGLLRLADLLQPLLPDGRLNPQFVSRLLWVGAVTGGILIIVGINMLASNSATQSDINSGDHLVLAGLAVQLFTYLCWFTIVAFLFYSPVYTLRTEQWPAMRRLFAAMLFTMTLVTLRGIYRVIQYAAGTNSSIAQQEAAYYVCDATLVFFALLSLALVDIGWTENEAVAEVMAKHNAKSPASISTTQMSVV